MPAGKGFADLVFVPRPQHGDKPALVVELKWNHDAETAIRQIKEKEYAGTLRNYAGKVILVGINYDKKTKHHECRIESLKKGYVITDAWYEKKAVHQKNLMNSFFVC